jgi:hypothetical protein
MILYEYDDQTFLWVPAQQGAGVTKNTGQLGRGQHEKFPVTAGPRAATVKGS